MKIPNLRKKIIINFSITGALLFVLLMILLFIFHVKKDVSQKVAQIKSETTKVQNQILDLESKTVEIKKYRILWKTLNQNKKTPASIKMDEINANLNSIAEKHSILRPTIKLTLPEVLKEGLFRRPSISVSSTNVSVTFNSPDDSRALSFVTDFINSLPGYVVVTNLNIKKSKSYTSKDLIELSSGKDSAAMINAKLDFIWYVYKNRDSRDKLNDEPVEKRGAGQNLPDKRKKIKLPEVRDAKNPTP
jgi:hypothetical protein